MVLVGLSFAMVERGGAQWWVIPLFGCGMLAIAVVAVRRVPASPSSATPASPSSPSPASPASASPSPVGPVPVAAPAGSVAVSRRLAEQLSPREMDVLRELAAGRSNKEIAKALFVAPGTVKAHLNHIFHKLDAVSRLEAVAHARAAGLLD
jgi:DNA-binding CsgD family transcriptional regulator